MVADNTSTFTAAGSTTAKTSGQTIDAASFRQMVDVLDALIQHSHTFSDDYTSNCQCNCARGSI
jgi:hypothetical protein